MAIRLKFLRRLTPRHRVVAAKRLLQGDQVRSLRSEGGEGQPKHEKGGHGQSEMCHRSAPVVGVFRSRLRAADRSRHDPMAERLTSRQSIPGFDPGYLAVYRLPRAPLIF